MGDVIKLLPDHISNQIAAGEVIQRPASAVKELMENSVDSGATQIKLIIKESGKTLIQVIDNGCGMSETDARLCFEKHATSKIRNIDDLFAIRTMGFRGEAMASIAAIAQVEMKTKQHHVELGSLLRIEGSEVLTQEHCATPDGTNLMVKNLFYNVPARRNFLKSNAVETRHIIDEFQRIALAHPEIQFSLVNNEFEVYNLRIGNLKQRMVAMMGDQYQSLTVPVEERSDHIQVYGFVGKPELAKKTRGEQWLFVNKRFIRSNYLHHAVMQAYADMLPKDTYPFYMLFIDINPNLIDINVHPTKQEIKFEDERLVYTFVNAGIRHSLARFSVTPTLDFTQEGAINNWEAFLTMPAKNDDEKQVVNPVKGPSAWSMHHSAVKKNTQQGDWEELYKAALDKPEETMTVASGTHESLIPQQEGEMHRIKAPYQIHQRYIIMPIRSGFIVIDQQAAHERVLYEKYLMSFQRNKISGQRQLFPQTIEFSLQDAALLLELLNDINQVGFEIQHFGGSSFVVHSFPADLAVGTEKKVLEEMLETYKSSMQDVSSGKRENLAKSLAKSSAIKAGKVMDDEEMNLLIDELFSCENPYATPSGRSTFINFDFDSLEEKFQKRN